MDTPAPGPRRWTASPVVLGVILPIGLEMLAAGPFIAYQMIFAEIDMGLDPSFFGYRMSAQMLGNLAAATFLTRLARRVAAARPDDTLIQSFSDRRLLGTTFAPAGVSDSVSEVTSILLAGWLMPRVSLGRIYLACAGLQAAGIVVGMHVAVLHAAGAAVDTGRRSGRVICWDCDTSAPSEPGGRHERERPAGIGAFFAGLARNRAPRAAP